MTEVENIVLEHLRAIRGDTSRIKDDMGGMRVKMTAMRHEMSSFRVLQDLHHTDLASLGHRVERIERRLDLSN